MSPINAVLDRAGCWFLHSGIQEQSGGVARYYLSDSKRNARVSTEITGYAVSFLTWLHQVSGRAEHLEAAQHAADYLIRDAWDGNSATFPFEPVSNGEPAYSYFFDCGIITRGLLALWRATGNHAYLERAKECGLAMAFDFTADEAVHPILSLPDKQPVDYEPRWSRRPGCYQLKSALAWHDLAQATRHRELMQPYERLCAYSLATHQSFLNAESNRERVMDRLHAYAYFLEALLPMASRVEAADALRDGIARMTDALRAIAPAFLRSDVCAQLLRVRLFADALGAMPIDDTSASEEAEMILAFQVDGIDPRTRGGFWFGRKPQGMLPFVNPVSTAFCTQALAMWQQFQDGTFTPDVAQLV